MNCEAMNDFEKAVVAIRQDGYNEGFKDGVESSLDSAIDFVSDSINERICVSKVVYNDDLTIVKFVDGTSSIVRYNPFYGYPYDAEKAIMAALLKRMFGNSYIKLLKEYADPALYAKSKEGCDKLYASYATAVTSDYISSETMTPDGAAISNHDNSCGNKCDDEYDPAYDSSLWSRLDDDLLNDPDAFIAADSFDDDGPDPFDE